MKLYLFLLIYLPVLFSSCDSSFYGDITDFDLLPPFIGEAVSPLPVDEWFDQRLDHFDGLNNVTWKQLYRTNAAFVKSGANHPVFLMIGGAGKADPKWMVAGAWLTYAEKYGALCFQLEHRYYGKSHPTSDMSTKNLKYLSTDQALADIANFIKGMNKKYGLHGNKWVAFGGSYGGSLAAWFRNKYPHLVHAAVSSSSPLNAKADFSEYFDKVKEILNNHSQDCGENLSKAIHELRSMFDETWGPSKVRAMFKLCEPIVNRDKKDIQSFFESLSKFVSIVVVHNNNNHGSNFGATIDDLCFNIAGPPTPDIVERFAKFIKKLLSMDCLSTKYNTRVKKLRQIDLTTSLKERLRIYQCCAELGSFQTSEKNNSLFGEIIDKEYFEDLCTDIYDSSFNSKEIANDIDQTNIIYGGLDIKVTRVVFVQGSEDPWYPLGITHSKSDRAPAIFIEGCGNCANDYPRKPRDPKKLKEARKKISGLLKKWLSESSIE